jgi:hypothetical protein
MKTQEAGDVMNTRMVIESGARPMSIVEEGADAILYVATSPNLQGRTGLYFDGKRPDRAEARGFKDVPQRDDR